MDEELGKLRFGMFGGSFRFQFVYRNHSDSMKRERLVNFHRSFHRIYVDFMVDNNSHNKIYDLTSVPFLHRNFLE